jgi:hypothetical protein
MNDRVATSTFDPDVFMNQTIDQPIQDDWILCPEGEYQAIIDDFNRDAFRTNEFTYQKGPNSGLPGSMTTFNIPWVIQDDRAKAALNREKVVVPQPIILDFASDGSLDFGVNKNVKLGQVRTAVGQNQAGPWTPALLRGAGPCMVRVVHRWVEPKGKPKYQVAEVDRVVPIR